MKVLTAYLILVAIPPNINSLSLESQIAHSKTIFNYLRNRADGVLENVVGNTQCARDLKSLFTDLFLRKKWAWEMLDASGKLPSGTLSGNIFFVGSFDQCLNIRKTRGEDVIDGQYCTVVLLPSKKFPSDLSILLDPVTMLNNLGYNMSYHAVNVMKEIKLTYGICIPHSCSIGALQEIWDYIEHTLKFPVHVLFIDLLCRSKEKPIQPYSIDKYVYAAFGIYFVIVLVGTWYDVMIYQHLDDRKKQQYNYWVVFSLYTNGKKLFSNKTSWPKDDYLECIGGIKIMSMLWVVFGHRMLLNVFVGPINGLYLFEWNKNIENSFIIAGSFSVDTFLVMSGLLLSYGFLKYRSIAKKEEGIPLIPFYIYRFLRLSPALLATILFNMSVFKMLSDGPAWPAIAAKVGGSCLHTWWATLLFATNWIDFNYQCVEQSWYLAVDSQLYLISPIILLSLEKKPRKTIYACLGACIISAVYTFIITIQYKYGAICFEGDKASHEHIYQPAFVRMPPWLIGIILGYVIFQYQRVHIPQGANLCLWFFSLILMVGLILVHLVFTRNDYDPVRSALFNSCARIVWAIALSLIVFSCVSGHGGMINRFLSLPIFQILVKLSYSMYLVHFDVILYFVGGKKYPEYFSNVKGVHDFIGDLFFTFVVGAICCLLFESPFIAVSRIIINNQAIGKELVKNAIESKMKRKKNCAVNVHPYDEEKFISDKEFKML